MKVYLDNCCYNRPYDDQSQIRISLETQAKLSIQNLIKNNKLELVSSYVLIYENSKNPHELRKDIIYNFVKNNISIYIDIDRADEVKLLADKIILTGIKTADAYHVSCAILADSDYFLTTDKRLLKYKTDKIKILDPIDFLKELEDE